MSLSVDTVMPLVLPTLSSSQKGIHAPAARSLAGLGVEVHSWAMMPVSEVKPGPVCQQQQQQRKRRQHVRNNQQQATDEHVSNQGGLVILGLEGDMRHKQTHPTFSCHPALATREAIPYYSMVARKAHYLQCTPSTLKHGWWLEHSAVLHATVLAQALPLSPTATAQSNRPTPPPPSSTTPDPHLATVL